MAAIAQLLSTSLHGVADADAVVMLRCQLEDINDARDWGQGVLDRSEEMAYELQTSDLRSLITILEDRMAAAGLESIPDYVSPHMRDNTAHNRGSLAPDSALQIPRVAHLRPHMSAASRYPHPRPVPHPLISRAPESAAQPGSVDPAPDVTNGEGIKVRSDLPGSHDEVVAESSASAVSGESTNLRVICNACQDEIPAAELVDIGCEHSYCGPCLRDWFSASLLPGGSPFPPRCCIVISPADVAALLTEDIIRRYEELRLQLETNDPTYCFDPNCHAFIRPSNIIADSATCQICRKVTCTMCKLASHGGDCPEDEDLKKTLEMAKEKGWQRCPRCRVLVERVAGCDRMT